MDLLWEAVVGKVEACCVGDEKSLSMAAQRSQRKCYVLPDLFLSG
jgi:hypothetical protein